MDTKTHFKKLDIKCGIYDTYATITRHKNGDVTIKDPEIKWINNSGSLYFVNTRYTGPIAKTLNAIFSDCPPKNEYGDLTYLEFISDYK